MPSLPAGTRGLPSGWGACTPESVPAVCQVPLGFRERTSRGGLPVGGNPPRRFPCFFRSRFGVTSEYFGVDWCKPCNLANYIAFFSYVYGWVWFSQQQRCGALWVTPAVARRVGKAWAVWGQARRRLSPDCPWLFHASGRGYPRNPRRHRGATTGRDATRGDAAGSGYNGEAHGSATERNGHDNGCRTR